MNDSQRLAGNMLQSFKSHSNPRNRRYSYVMVAHLIRSVCAVCVALIAACGTTNAKSTCTPRPALPSPSAAAAPVSAVADRARVDPGATVTFTETITGSAALHPANCTDFHLNVWEAGQNSIYSTDAPIVQNGTDCSQMQLRQGDGVNYIVSWPVDPTLPGGEYNAELSLADAPTLTMTIIVGTAPAGC